MEQPGGVRLYETAAVFAERPVEASKRSSAESIAERRVLAIAMDVPNVGKGKPGTVDQRQHALRVLRGAIESAIGAAAGAPVRVEVEAGGVAIAAFDAAASGRVLVGEDRVPAGVMGVVAGPTQQQFDLASPVVAAEIEMDAILRARAPRKRVEMLPAFPGIERDVSLIVREDVAWARIEAGVREAAPARLVGVSFVGTYRGKPIEPGEKSVTLRMSFREGTRTLRDEEITPEVERVVAHLKGAVGASVRAG